MTVVQGGYPPNSGPARTVGESLRATRVAAGASVEQVEADLRIKAKYIEAIEDGDLDILPSRAYTDGFLRNYATYLGMDPGETVRRFAGENGLAAAPSAKVLGRNASAKKGKDPFAGFAPPPPRRGGFLGGVGRGVLAMWPLALVAGLGYSGYTGYVAARDAGLLPPQLVELVNPSATETPDPVRTASAEEEPAETPAPEVTGSADNTAAERKLAEAAADDNPVRTAMARMRAQIVGAEVLTGRPDSLSYTRPGSVPYWLAKPPAVEPADGPVADIEPETAGLQSDDEPDAAENRLRWAARDNPAESATTVDASSIAAAAREALAGAGFTPSAPPRTETHGSLEQSNDPAPAEAEIAALEIDTPAQTETETLPEYGIGPVETVEAAPEVLTTPLAPAQPASPPRRFALIAAADTWVQVTDQFGSVTYTGILSPGEAYNIPAQQGLRLKTGNAGGLLIEVDGQRFGPLGNNGAVMRNVVLDPGAVRASFTLSQSALLAQ